jgi:hypothetical protein
MMIFQAEIKQSFLNFSQQEIIQNEFFPLYCLLLLKYLSLLFLNGEIIMIEKNEKISYELETHSSRNIIYIQTFF